MESQKKCPNCETMKCFEYFYNDKTKSDKLSSWCKSCMKEKLRDKYAANPELKRQKVNAYDKENKLLKKVKNEIYYEKNSEKISKQQSESKKLFRAENPELARAQDAEKRKKYAESIKLSKLRYREKNKINS